MKRSEKKELGLLPRQIYKGTKELIAEGEIEAGASAKEMAFVYMAHVVDEPEYSEAWGRVYSGDYGLDLDAIYEFIVKIMELIEKLMPLFT